MNIDLELKELRRKLERDEKIATIISFGWIILLFFI